MEGRTFYLTSKENQKLYPACRYPITHSIYAKTVEYEICEKLKKLKDLMPVIFVAFCWSFLYLLIYVGHIRAYNVIYGPFHMNMSNFVEHVEKFKRGHRPMMQYIQVELGEGNIETPRGSYETIRHYLNSKTRKPHQHIATYKKLITPQIYVKLPTRHVPQVHKKFPFDFYQFSLETLKCILNTLISKHPPKSAIKFKEKSDIVNYIKTEYSKNSTSFNMLILTKCGILIGYLYEPRVKNDRAFIPTKEHIFHRDDIAFETSIPYFSIISVEALNVALFIAAVFCYIYYYSIWYFYQFFSFQLRINREIKEKLEYLKLSGPSYKQLLKLDEIIERTEHQFKNQLFIIKSTEGKYLIVILPVKRDNICRYTRSSSFRIFLVSKIQSVQTEGIYYTDDRNHEIHIKWPTTSTKEKKEYALWFHEKLLAISIDYRNVINREELHDLTTEEEREFAQRHPILAYSQVYPNWLGFVESLITQRPLSAREIARFRFYNKHTYADDKITGIEKCVICQEKFVLNERYVIWPCSSNPPHLFHYDCILEQFRTNNACPICRGPARF